MTSVLSRRDVYCTDVMYVWLKKSWCDVIYQKLNMDLHNITTNICYPNIYWWWWLTIWTMNFQIMSSKRHIVPGRHDVTMIYVALMVNNGFIHARRGIVSSQEKPVSLTWLQYMICKMMVSIIKDKCDATYNCDGTSWRHYDLRNIDR